MLSNYIQNDWAKLLQDEFKKSYFLDLTDFLDNAYKNNIIYPRKSHIFKAFNLTPFEEVKVVILGQDPYHGDNQAHGLSFSVPTGEKLPPSLKNIYKELYEDLKISRITGNLEDWASQGVLLLNDVLTVERGKARSHRKKGWELFTKSIIELLNHSKQPIVFILWGNDAIKKETLIDEKHIIIKGPHPSPLSAYRGFFGSKCFSLCNEHLTHLKRTPINW